MARTTRRHSVHEEFLTKRTIVPCPTCRAMGTFIIRVTSFCAEKIFGETALPAETLGDENSSSSEIDEEEGQGEELSVFKPITALQTPLTRVVWWATRRRTTIWRQRTCASISASTAKQSGSRNKRKRYGISRERSCGSLTL